MSYSEYMPKHERPVVSMLIREALAAGYTISVNDGEEWTVKRSTSGSDIREALCTAEDDTLLLRDSEGKKVGHFWLIYNNGSEGDPIIVITDYSATPECEEIYRKLSEKYG